MASVTEDLAAWLGRHGLSHYEQTFVENHIEFALLPDLTENDLENLGVSLGHRKKLLRAIEELREASQAGEATTTVSKISTEASLLRGPGVERRQITVLFCDLVGSTELSCRLDPEDFQVLIDEYRQVCVASLTRYEGFVARYFGDGVMAYFGWPQAHEDDPVRAVHAGLAIVSAVAKILGPVSLSVRVGISSGPVVVGERDGPANSMDAVGETPNIAARLQALASPNTVIISEFTKRLVSGTFDLDDLGSHTPAGVAAPFEVYRVRSAKSAVSRFEAAHVDSLTPFVGRTTELNLLLDRWQKAKEGEGQVVLLSGIPGVGKSRLIHEFKLNIQHEPHILLSHQCSPYHSQSAFFPVIAEIEQSAQLTGHESDVDKLAKLKNHLLRWTDGSTEPLPLIAKLLSIPAEDLGELSELTSQQVKNRTIAALVDRLLTLSVERPVLCIFEDVHWMDPSTLELLELAVSQIDRARILIIVSCRPEFRPTLVSSASITMYSLTRLSRGEVSGMVKALMVRGLMPGQSVPKSILDQIVERSDGVPLFIEELTSSITKAPLTELNEGDARRAAYAGTLTVPDTLHDALMERLDRVAQGRRLAQIAAVIGREFSYDLLAAVSRIGDDEIRKTLSLLEEAAIIHRVGISPLTIFAFKHALLRDAIYNSLLKSARRQIHADIAATLADHSRGIVTNRLEILAYHHTEAGNHQLATRYWYEAGQRALAYSANVEAIAHYRKALELLRATPDTPGRNRQEVEILLALGIPLIAVRGYAAAETRDAFAQARTLCLRLDDPPEYFQALYGLCAHAWMSGKNHDAVAMASEFLSRSQASADPVLSMVAHRLMGSTLLTAGEFVEARKHFEGTIILSRGKGKRTLYSRYMVEPEVASLLLLSWNKWFLGYPDQALSRVAEALALAENLKQPYTIAFGHYMTSVVHLLRGEPGPAIASAERSLDISREQRFSLYILLSTISRGRALSDLGRLEEAQIEMQHGIDEVRREGVGFMRAMMDSWLADSFHKSGETEAATSIVEKAIANISAEAGRPWESELHHQRGQFLLALDQARISEAEAHFKKAIEVARLQSARSLELRAATSLAELWRMEGRYHEARDLVGAISRCFTEGAQTKDLRRARDLEIALG